MKISKAHKFFSNLLLTGTVLALVALVGCETNSYINPQEYLDREQEILTQFYNKIVDTVDNEERTWLDTMTAYAIDTVDHRYESGMMLFHTKVGEGDSILLFKQVGFRYSLYELLVDEETDIPDLYYAGSNEYAQSPVVYSTFIVNDINSSASTGVPQGVNEAILNMRYGGECRVVVPSLINSGSSYVTTVYDLKITYLED